MERKDGDDNTEPFKICGTGLSDRHKLKRWDKGSLKIWAEAQNNTACKSGELFFIDKWLSKCKNVEESIVHQL